MTVDVLNLEWSSAGRDREVVLPIQYYCEKILGLSFRNECIFDYYYWLNRLQPKMLFIASTAGAKINVEAARYATEHSIPVLTLVAEGNFVADYLDQMLWGWKEPREFFESRLLLWSEKSRKMILGKYPGLAEKLSVSGSVGFDRYRYGRFQSRENLLKSVNKPYEHVIGIAGWGFDLYEGDRFEKNREMLLGLYNMKEIERFREDRKALRDVLHSIISKMKDTLFVLKFHPACIDKDLSEFEGLESFANTITLHRGLDIADCIAPCDLWVAYESTTALEAWLLNKEVILINPSGPDFKRDQIFNGCTIVTEATDFIQKVEELWRSGTIEDFANKKEVRIRIITEVGQWFDGKNHMRVGDEIKEFLQGMDSQAQGPSFMEWLRGYIRHLRFWSAGLPIIGNLPYISTLREANKRFSHVELESKKQIVWQQLDEFYKKAKLSK